MLINQDNSALSRASFTASENDPIVGLFIVSPAEWKKHDVAPIRVDFWLRNLRCLKEKLAELKIPLIIKYAETIPDVPRLVLETSLAVNAKYVYCNKEYEVNEAKRDEKAASLLEENSISFQTFDDQCIVTPGKVLTKESKTYTIFTPFKKRYCHISFCIYSLTIAAGTFTFTRIQKKSKFVPRLAPTHVSRKQFKNTQTQMQASQIPLTVLHSVKKR